MGEVRERGARRKRWHLPSLIFPLLGSNGSLLLPLKKQEKTRFAGKAMKERP